MHGKPIDVERPRITARSITRLYGEKLQAGRKRAGLSQQQAADGVGVDQATISRWERGEKQPAIEYLMALAKLYGAKVSEIMPRNQYPSAPLDPAERQLWVWRRNARIQKVPDVEEYVRQMRAQREQALGYDAAKRP
jgi:transcriptional regulator with XRE-family HTH domain